MRLMRRGVGVGCGFRMGPVFEATVTASGAAAAGVVGVVRGGDGPRVRFPVTASSGGGGVPFGIRSPELHPVGGDLLRHCR